MHVGNRDRNDLQNVASGVGKGEVESSILSGSTIQNRNVFSVFGILADTGGRGLHGCFGSQFGSQENVMGINICMVDGAGDRVPEWDWIRYAGDRDFPQVVSGLEIEQAPASLCVRVDDYLFRPKSISAWRARIAEVDWPNPGRFEHMLDLLEADPNRWLYYSL